MIQLLYCPAKSRFQTGLTLEAFWQRLKGLTGTRDYERLCEIGQEVLGATRQTWWRRTGRAGGLFAAVEGVADVREMDESSTGDYERLGQKTFDASRQTGGWVKAAGVVAAGGHRPRWRPFCGGWRG